MKKRDFIRQVLTPYRIPILVLILLSLSSSIFDGLSIGMLIPLLAGLQQISHFDELPWALKFAVGLFTSFSPDKQVLYAGVLVVLAVVIKNCLLAASLYMGYGLASRIIGDLRSRAVELLLHVGLEFHQKEKVGRLADKVLHNTEMLQELFRSVVGGIVNIISLAVLSLILFIISWKLAIMSLIFGVAVWLIVAQYIRRLTHIGRKSAENHQHLASSLVEMIRGIRTIRSFVKEDRESRHLEDRIRAYQKTVHGLYFGNSFVYILTEVLSVVIVGLILIFMVLTYSFDNQLLIVHFLPFLYIITRMVPLVKLLNRARGHVTSHLPFLNLTFDLLRLDDKPFIRDGNQTYRGLKESIVFHSVSFNYEKDNLMALENVSFSIPKGKITAIVGESGAGKSSIVNLLLRFYDPQQGEIFIDGTSLRQLRIHEFRRSIGLVSQDALVFSDSVRNNIIFGLDNPPTDEQIEKAATDAGVSSFVETLEAGYDTVLGDTGSNLSGGQRQRISIARALIKNPEILILDEATSALDAPLETEVYNAIFEEKERFTTIIITHRLSAARRADQIVVFKGGRVVEIGSESELMARKGEFFYLASKH